MNDFEENLKFTRLEDKVRVLVKDKVKYHVKDFRWSKVRKSRFIERIIIGLPIPDIYIYGSDNIIVDGVNRVKTIKDFCYNKFPLSQLILLERFNGLYYKELDKDTKTKIIYTTIDFVCFLHDDPTFFNTVRKVINAR